MEKASQPRLVEPPQFLGIAQAIKFTKPVEIAEFAKLPNCKIGRGNVNPNESAAQSLPFSSASLVSNRFAFNLCFNSHEALKDREKGLIPGLETGSDERRLVFLTKSRIEPVLSIRAAQPDCSSGGVSDG